MIKYSFLVPVYNVEKYLKKCLDSLVMQDGTNVKYEVVLVDDGSTDASGKICDKYADLYSFIRVIHQNNRGLMQARRTGVEAAKGIYLIFVDSDDYVDNNLLSIVDSNIETYSPDFVMCSHYRTKNGIDIPVFLTDEPRAILSQTELIELIARSDHYNGMARKVVKSAIFKEHLDEIYNYSVSVGEDKIQTAFLIKYSTKCIFLRDCLYHYVMRDDSLAHKKSIGDVREIISVYNIVRNIIIEIIDGLNWERKDREVLFRKYDCMALEGTLDAIYKYDKRKDISFLEKCDGLKQLYNEYIYFFKDCRSYRYLSIHNCYRARLFRRGKFFGLLVLDLLLSIVR